MIIAPTKCGIIDVVIDTTEGTIRVLQKDTGEVLQSFGPSGTRIMGAHASCKKNTIVIDCDDGSIQCWNFISGMELWKKELGSAVMALTAVSNGVVVGLEDGIVIWYDRAGLEVWKKELGSRVTALAAVSNAVVVGLDDGTVIWYDPAGLEIWKKELGSDVTALTAVSSGVVVGLVNGTVIWYDPAGLEV
jgi:outer membrane protein assembly factor BamB